MKALLPQEIDVWYLIPAIRKELTRILVKEENFSQKDTAKLLDITEPAVSQYLNSKRGGGINFTKIELAKIKKASKELISKKKGLLEILYKLADGFRKSQKMCIISKHKGKDIPEHCKIEVK